MVTNEVIIRKDGFIRIGKKVLVRDTIKEVTNILNSSEVELENSYKISIDEIKEIIPDVYNVYRWKGYYILAKSTEEAQRVWETYVDRLNIMAEDSNPNLLWEAKKFKELSDPELFPRIIKRLKCQHPFPCILKNLDFDEDPIFIYRWII